MGSLPVSHSTSSAVIAATEDPLSLQGPGALMGLGSWEANGTAPTTDLERIREALHDLSSPLHFVRDGRNGCALGLGGKAVLGRSPSEDSGSSSKSVPLLAFVPRFNIKNFGDAAFCRDLGIRYPYLSGAMANGIASEEIVEAMAEAGMLGFFGAAGLSVERVEQAIDRLQDRLEKAGRPFGFNLIHAPNEPDHEAAIVALFLRRGVRLVEASAYLDLTLPLVRFRVSGIRKESDGTIVAPHRIVAKASRIEVAEKFFSPPPEKFLHELISRGEITEEQARWASEIPLAQDLTAEADSGGHTDNRPALTMLPTFLALRDRMQSKWGYGSSHTLRVGAAGGISTPASTLAAFSLGAAYVLTGTVNQACVESGSSDVVRKMLADARQADVAMAPAADMFEMGVKLQVLKRGTMFPMRAAKLYELYRACDSVEDIPAEDLESLEKKFFRSSLGAIWEQTRAFFLKREPRQIERAERDPKHKMALIFRWYLGMSSRWANDGQADRQIDFQIWCGPAMGAFNEWTRGSFLAKPENRSVVVVALNLLYGAAVLQRVNFLRTQGVSLPSVLRSVEPLRLDELNGRLGD